MVIKQGYKTTEFWITAVVNIAGAVSMAEELGPELAAALRRASLEIYARGAAYAERRGIIIADTKFEFGLDGDGRRRTGAGLVYAAGKGHHRY